MDSDMRAPREVKWRGRGVLVFEVHFATAA
jgi:hypothetical protein